MAKNSIYHYFVEGECEAKLIKEFKENSSFIVPGKVEIRNVVQEKLTNGMLRTLKENTTIILVFDTDIDKLDVLMENIRTLKNASHVKETWCVLQVRNFEDELIRATDIKQIRELIGSKTNSEFKSDIIKEKNLMKKLLEHNFEIDRFWVSTPDNGFRQIENCGNKVKKK